MPDYPLPDDYVGAPVDGSPVFIGHYWMTGHPGLQSLKVACVDYSAAKDSPLLCYRWAFRRARTSGPGLRDHFRRDNLLYRNF